jgi:hypothetical protein
MKSTITLLKLKKTPTVTITGTNIWHEGGLKTYVVTIVFALHHVFYCGSLPSSICSSGFALT